ncbi:hypothetical protein BG74_05045 [Sodalis-like endosymbiont of Proechinophthirus fluctus]|nr:hypothetical protein BG74_05045 [Sodalis-like endosymbiont of Proechinophthirus fluctus]
MSDPLWAMLSTDKANWLERNCHYFRDCPFYLARVLPFLLFAIGLLRLALEGNAARTVQRRAFQQAAGV